MVPIRSSRGWIVFSNLVIILPICCLFLVACGKTGRWIVIDSGHTPMNYGAVSCTDKKEVDYNDELVGAISRELIQKHIQFIVTRAKDRDMDDADALRHYLVDPLDDGKWQNYRQLYSRIAIANKMKADLFISIHHDSVQEHHLRRTEDGKIIDVRDDFKQQFNPGYSIYISCDPAYPNTERNFSDSLKFAEIFAGKMEAIGRKPSTYHEEKPGQDNYVSLDPSRGIYDSKAILAVLRNAEMPAVLIEAGVIVDAEDEKLVSSTFFRKQFAELLAESIEIFFSPPD